MLFIHAETYRSLIKAYSPVLNPGQNLNRSAQSKTRALPGKRSQQNVVPYVDRGLPGDSCGKESACQCRRCRFNPWVGKIPWRKKWQPTPGFLPGKSHPTEQPGGLQSMESQRLGPQLSMHAVTLIGRSLPESPILSYGFPSDLPLLPHPLPISFSSLQSTSLYQFFNYFLMICVHHLSFWFPVSLNLFSPFHFMPLFPFPTIELILLCDSSLTWPILGLHYNLWTKKSPAIPFFINQMSSRTQWKEICWACSKVLTPDGSWAASSPTWGVSSVLKHWLRENKTKPPLISQLHSFKEDMRYASVAFSEPLKLHFVSG